MPTARTCNYAGGVHSSLYVSASQVRKMYLQGFVLATLNFSPLYEWSQSHEFSQSELRLNLVLQDPKVLCFMAEDIEDWQGMSEVIKSVKAALQYEELNTRHHPWIVDLLFDWLSAQQKVRVQPFGAVMGVSLTKIP